jgi:hypothetical protein
MSHPPHTTTVVERIPPCDVDALHGPAVVDARMNTRSSWGYFCQRCWEEYGCRGLDGKLLLGLGHGQRLIVRGESEPAKPLFTVAGLLESMGIAVSYDDGESGR